MSVAATGSAPFSYQWYAGASGSTSAPLAGATSTGVTTPALAATTSYWVRVWNSAGSADSATATVTVTVPPSTPAPAPAPPPPAAVAPSVTSQPQSQTIASGQTATLTVAASGTAPFTYQWYAGASGTTTSPVAGATSASLTTAALTSTSSFWVRVSNAAGSASSVAATVTVTPPPPAGVAPAITSQPQSQAVANGQSASLSAAASGTAPFTYQWYAGASGSTTSPLGGATSASLTTPALTSTTSFWVRVSNAYGTVDSAAATVTVTATAGGNASFEDQVLVLINQRRVAGATCGGTPYPPVAALTMNANLRTAARGHSEDMATQNYFSHTSLDGRTFSQRISNAGYTGAHPWGENIAAGQPNAAVVVDGWMASTGHCTNIMNGGYHSVGIGYAFRAGSPYYHYWTQDFGGG